MFDKIADFVTDWGIVAVAIIGVIVILLGIRLLYKMWPILSRTIEIGNTMLTLPETVEQVKKMAIVQSKMQDDLAAVKHEVQNNDGSSLKDSVGNVQRALDAHIAYADSALRKLSKTLGTHTTKLRANTATLAKVEEMSEQAAAVAPVITELIAQK